MAPRWISLIIHDGLAGQTLPICGERVTMVLHRRRVQLVRHLDVKWGRRRPSPWRTSCNLRVYQRIAHRITCCRVWFLKFYVQSSSEMST
jgi:hypothetical protein